MGLLALLALVFACCSCGPVVDVHGGGDEEPECTSEDDPCFDTYGEGFVCCLREGVCVVDDPIACGNGEEL